MEKQRVSRSELAKRLGTTPGYITQLLDGTTNMTIAKASDVFLALGREFHPSDSPIGFVRDDPMTLTNAGWWGPSDGDWASNLRIG
jgi:transcriptional regulator with XRE-family HTH domain